MQAAHTQHCLQHTPPLPKPRLPCSGHLCGSSQPGLPPLACCLKMVEAPSQMAQAEMPLDQKRCSLGRFSFLAVAPCNADGPPSSSGRPAGAACSAHRPIICMCSALLPLLPASRPSSALRPLPPPHRGHNDGVRLDGGVGAPHGEGAGGEVHRHHVLSLQACAPALSLQQKQQCAAVLMAQVERCACAGARLEMLHDCLATGKSTARRPPRQHPPARACGPSGRAR